MVPFKADVTLATVRVDINGRVPLVESLVMLKKMFDINNGRRDWGDTGETKLVVGPECEAGSLCGTVTFHCRIWRLSMVSLVLHINVSFPPGQSDITLDIDPIPLKWG